MAAPNIANTTQIFGKTAVQSVGTSATAIVSNSAGSGKVLKVNALYLANIDGSVAVNVNVDLFRSSVAYNLAFTIAVPADATLDFLSKSIYLEEGDDLRLTASATGDLQAICSYEEIS
jgi:hypothetical protein